MKFVKGEALQSWIYRNIIVNGFSDFSSVIGSDGLWHRYPYFPKEVKVEYSSIPDQELLGYLRLSGIGIKKASLLENPTLYVNEVYDVFPQSHHPVNNSKGKVTIAFCNLCIKAAIENNGFGYIKSEWLYGSKCTIHNMELGILESNSRKDTLVKLSCILKGAYFKKSFNESEMKFIKEEVESFDFHFMPCIINEFYKTISNQFYGIARIYSKEKFYFADGRKKKMHEFNIDSELTNFMSFNALDFNEFVDERAEVIFHTFGINQNNSLSERIIKKKGENCSKCYQWTRDDKCPIAPIKMFVLDKDGYVDAEYLSNPCDIRLKKTYNNIV